MQSASANCAWRRANSADQSGREVKGDSRALNIAVDGTIEGDMYALESISIRATARVNGNLFAPLRGC
jgi:cytoskeletal protein CcmA (bactofilin family)